MKLLLTFVTLLMIPASMLGSNPFAGFKGELDPIKVGDKVCKRFVETPHPNFDANPQPTREITYPETCAWLGALRYAEKRGDTLLINQLEKRFVPIVGEERSLQPLPDHVDHSVFGTIPLQLYILKRHPLYHAWGNGMPMHNGAFRPQRMKRDWQRPVDILTRDYPGRQDTGSTICL